MTLEEKSKLKKKVCAQTNIWELMRFLQDAERNILRLKSVIQHEVGAYAHEKECMSTAHLIEYYAYEMELAARQIRKSAMSVGRHKASELRKRILNT
jgi:hypothetical protein